MTNIEILKFLIGCNAEYTESQLEAYLILNDLVPGDAYLLQNKCVIYGIAIQAIESQPQSGIKQIQEGGYTITYSGSQMSGVLSSLADQSGCEELIAKYYYKPSIVDKSSLW